MAAGFRKNFDVCAACGRTREEIIDRQLVNCDGRRMTNGDPPLNDHDLREAQRTEVRDG